MNMTLISKLCAYFFRQLSENVRPGIAHDGMYRIKAQPIEVIFLQPIKCIVNVKLTNWTAIWTIEVDRLSPRCFVSLRKKIRRIQPKVIAFGPEVVVDHVQKHHHVFRVRRINEPLQIVGTSIRPRWRIKQHSVVSPIALSRKTR